MVSSCQFHYTWRSCFSICNILPCFVSRVYFRLSDDGGHHVSTQSGGGGGQELGHGPDGVSNF